MKIILLFFLLSLYTSTGSVEQTSKPKLFRAKCPDDKSKAKYCAFSHQAGTEESPKTEFLIFKKCGKGEKCEKNLGICIGDPFKQRKNGKSCNYDQDCISGLCISNKCGGKKENEVCGDTEDDEDNDESCEPGLICHEYSDDAEITEKKCVKLVLTAGTKPEHTECGEGLAQDADEKCQKYGTIEDGKETRDPLLCKSGIAHYTTDGKICDRIEEEPVCGTDGVTTKGKWAKGGEIPLTDGGCYHAVDYNGKDIYYYQYTKLKSKLYEDFLEDYEDLDIEKLNTEDKYANLDFKGMLKWKTKKKYLLFEYAPELQAAGLIDNDGKVVKDKKCEYEFLMKNELSSSNTKVGFLLLVLFALLL